MHPHTTTLLSPFSAHRCIGDKIAPIFYNTMEDSGALPLEMPVTELNMGDMIDVFPYEGVTKRHGTDEVRLSLSLSLSLYIYIYIYICSLVLPFTRSCVCVSAAVCVSYLCLYLLVCCLCARPSVCSCVCPCNVVAAMTQSYPSLRNSFRLIPGDIITTHSPSL
jgi:hypothetical protein